MCWTIENKSRHILFGKTHFGKIHFDKNFTSITTTTTRLVLNSYDTALTKLLPNSYQTPTKLQLNSVKPLTHIVTVWSNVWKVSSLYRCSVTVHRHMVSSLVGFQFLFCDECFITISQVIKLMMWKSVSKPDSSWRNEKCDGYPTLIWVSKNIYCTLQLFARAIGFTPKDMTFNYDDQKTSDQSWKFHFKFSTVSGLKYPEIHRIQEHQILRIIKSWGQTILKSWGLRILNPRLQDIQSWDYIILGFRILKS